MGSNMTATMSLLKKKKNNKRNQTNKSKTQYNV